MTQASLPSNVKSVISPMPSATASGDAEGGHSAATYWLFGLTAMTLVFASVLLLGLLARSGIIDSSVRVAVNAYTVLTASIGLGALAYVVVMGRRAGLFKSLDAPAEDVRSSGGVDGLLIAATVPPIVSVRTRQEAAQARESRSRRARTIAAAATLPQRPRHQTPFPSRPVSAPPQRAVRLAPYPPMQVAPAMRPPTAAMPSVSAPAMTRLSAPAIPAVPRISAPVMPARRVSVAAAQLRLRPPFMMPRGAPVALQIRTAGLRAPYWDRPSDPTLVDRLAGRGTHRPSPPSGPPPTAAPRAYRAPQVVGQS